MSTQINVTVGSGGLSDKAKQLQAAARQAQLEKERTAQIEADSTEQRNARLAANRQAPDGTSLYSVPNTVPFAERRPAASRSTLIENYLFVPKIPISSRFASGINELRYNETAKGFSGLTLCRHFTKLGLAGSDFIESPTQYYSATEGPNSKSAHVIPPVYDLPPLDPFGENAYRGFSIYNQRLYTAEDGSRILPAVPKTSSITKVKNFTFEFFVRFGDAVTLAGSDTYNTSLAVDINVPLDLDLPNQATAKFSCFKNANFYNFNLSVAKGALRVLPGTTIGSYSYSKNLSGPGTASTYNLAPASTIYSYTDGGSLPFLLGTWTHVACVKRNSVLSWYMDGVLVWKFDSAINYWDMSYFGLGTGFTAVYPPIRLEYEVDSTIAVTQRFVEGMAVHGLRFTTKALYADGFTPPLDLEP